VRPTATLAAFVALAVAGCDAPSPGTGGPETVAATSPATTRPPSASRFLGLAVRDGVGGVMIVGMDLDGPAASAGALVGDFITAVNGATVGSEGQLAGLLAAAARSGSVTLDLWRQGEMRKASITTSPGALAAQTPNEEPPFGLHVRELPQATLKSLGVRYGLMVTRLGEPASRSRLLPGDVIVGVNRTRIRSLQEFNRLLADRGNGAIALLVRRADADLYIPLDTPARDTPLRT
jgi:serine protease Do